MVTSLLDFKCQVLTRKEGRAFVADVNPGDAVRTPGARQPDRTDHANAEIAVCMEPVSVGRKEAMRPSETTRNHLRGAILDMFPDGRRCLSAMPRYNAVLAAIDLFTAKQQRVLQVGC